MAYFHVAQDDSLAALAAVDLSAHQFRAVSRNADGELIPAAAGDCAGILENTPTAGKKGNYYIGGIVPAVAGAAFAVEAKLTTDAQSRLVPAAADRPYQYRAEEAATAVNQVVSVKRETGATPPAAV